MYSNDPNDSRHLLDRAARAITALLDVIRGEPMSAEVVPAAADLAPELRTYLVEKGAR